MNKRILLISGILLTLGLSCLGLYNVNNNDRLIVENNKSNNKVVSSNAVTMMYETEAGSDEYQISTDNTWPQEGYVFNEKLSACENGSTLTWDDENKKIIMSTSISDKCYVYFDKKPDIIYLADYIKSLYTEDGANGIYLHDGVGSYTNANQEAGDNSYRYAGANPNNYICFGTNTSPCPTDNLYRIIGVFGDQVKLIKYDYANNNLLGTNGDYSENTYIFWWGESSYYKGSLNLSSLHLYYWNWNYNAQTITWSESELNTINLNTNYLTVTKNRFRPRA